MINCIMDLPSICHVQSTNKMAAGTKSLHHPTSVCSSVARRGLRGGGVAKRGTWHSFSFWQGGWFSFSSSKSRVRYRRSCHKEQGDTTRRPAEAVGVCLGGGRREEGACGGASGENRWSVGGVGGSAKVASVPAGARSFKTAAARHQLGPNPFDKP